MATITDFNGVVGASEIRGTAHGSDGSLWDFDTDMRFMQGQYVDRPSGASATAASSTSS